MNIYGQSYRFGIGSAWTPAVKGLIIANIVCFVLQNIAELVFKIDFLQAWFALCSLPHPELPAQLTLRQDFAVWQLFTYMFLHGDIWHILFNMLVLWMFGCELERFWGTTEFLRYYFICGVGAGLVHLMLNFNSPIPVLGASGAIFGVLAAFGLTFPDLIITFLLFFILPVQIKAKYLVMIVAAIALYMGVQGAEDGVAHFAHLGGMVVGFLYLKIDWPWKARGPRNFDHYSYTAPGARSTPFFGKISDWFKQRAQSRRRMQVVRRRQHEMHLREKVDAILDKINEVGFDNLTSEEKQILKRASQTLNQENIRSEDFGPN